MATICLYQDTRHESPLLWMREIFGIGYISHRKDSITELRVNGFASVRRILILLQPYIRFKQVQVTALLNACEILGGRRVGDLNEVQLKELVDLVFLIRENNYKSRQTLTKETLLLRLGLTP